MCGIVGCILKNKKAAPILVEATGKLEYRGYDSVGIATIDEEGIHLKKDAGKVEDLDEKLHLSDLPGTTGIGHVRWATHGIPNQANAHPHLDDNDTIAVVHNGIIENYGKLKLSLENEGHVFKSHTDTEVIPHLLEKFMKEGKNLEDAMTESLKLIKGSYAIAAISKSNPNQIVATRKDSPLIVGIGDDEFYLASDIPAILKYTRNIIHIDDYEIVVLNDEALVIKDLDGNTIEKEIEVTDWTEDMAEKEGYDFFTIKEINEEPKTVRDTLKEKNEVKKAVSQLGDIDRICFVACGTSYHASLVGKYLIEDLIGIPTEVLLASEFRHSVKTLTKNTLTIFLSQSGETADTIKALRLAKDNSKTLSIVNVLGSTIAREADYNVYTLAGPEIGVAATKSYISQLVSIYLFVAYLAKNENKENGIEVFNRIMDSLNDLEEFVKGILPKEEQIMEIAKKYKDVQNFFFIGRGLSYPTSMEGSLKLKEISYIHAEGYAAGELKHGPLALIEEGVPVVVVIPDDEDHVKSLSNLKEVKSRGAHVISIASANDKVIGHEADEVIYMDESIDTIISPLTYVIPLQLLAFHISLARGLDPDKPKNLAKCVTVE
jgi:glucosamine--fructose-6-phosphate aminotransferase (isomerizing)